MNMLSDAGMEQRNIAGTELRDVTRVGRAFDRTQVARTLLGSFMPLIFAGLVIIMHSMSSGLLTLTSPIDIAIASAVLLFAISVVAVLWPGGVLGPVALIAVLGLTIALAALAWADPVVNAMAGLAMGPALARAAIQTLVLLEIGGAAYTLLRLPRADRDLVTEPGLLTSLWGLPPAFRALTRRSIAPKLLFILAQLAFATAFLQIGGLFIISLMNVVEVVRDCLLVGRSPCVKEVSGFADTWGWFGGWLLMMIIALGLALAFQRWARRSVVVSATTALSRDTRAPILFLRAFRNDQVKVASPAHTPLGLLLGVARGQSPLDHILIEEFAGVGPVVAIGKPGEATPPYGAWRSYPDATSDDAWRREVTELAQRAAAVVMVADDSEGVGWELEMLASQDLLDKTLLLAAPRFFDAADNAVLWASVDKRLRGTLALTPVAGRGALLSAHRSDTRRVHIAKAARFVRSDYVMALRWFFRQTSPRHRLIQDRALPRGAG